MQSMNWNLQKNLGDCNELLKLRTKALEPPMQKIIGLAGQGLR